MKNLRFRGSWESFKKSKPGWLVLVTLFVVVFGVLATVLAGLIGLPWLVKGESQNADLALGLIFPIVILAQTVFFAKSFSKNKSGFKHVLKDKLGWRKPNKKTLKLVPFTLIVYVALLVVSLSILQMFSPQLAEQKQEIASTVTKITGWRLALVFLSVAVITPIAEETFFRGFLIPLYAKRFKLPLAVLFSSILFALAHAQVNIGIDTFFFGLALGFLSCKTESIYPSIGLHVLKNSLALGVILNWRIF